MKQFLSVLVAVLFVIALVLNQALPADAAKKEAKKKGITQEELTDLSTKVNNLIDKIYRREYYTPEDANQLSDIKLQLDDRMDINPEVTFAPLYYKIGKIYRLRGKEKEAIECFQTVLENFIDTAYGPKAKAALTEMGVQINIPTTTEEDKSSEEF